MSQYADRAFSAIDQFNDHLSAFVTQVASTAVDPPRVPQETLADLLRITTRARTAAEAIRHSLNLINRTALDIVDMQVRLQGETARLASSLRELGKAVERQHFVRDAFDDALVPLDEAAQPVAAAVFPSAVQGLREVNSRLWDFEKIEWKRYTDIFTAVLQRNTITLEQQSEIESIADDVARAFAEVNTLLNDLAESRVADADRLQQRLRDAPLRLTTALQLATERMEHAPRALEVFAPVIHASREVAEDVGTLLGKLTIPVFPVHPTLGECCDYISSELYDRLSGIQAFALLNILARLQATKASGRTLLADRRATVFAVFADRIYMEVDRSLIDDVAADTSTFVRAPASLHRFKEGSFKQKTHPEGNLQISFASRSNDRVAIDADIDLYPTPVRHLFGEVLVNHLTGSATSQYAVRRILEQQKIPGIGGFRLLPGDGVSV